MKDLTILVVDDEPDLGELVAFEFELVGANVLNAANGKEAFEIVKKSDVDVIVSDIRMPGGDGVDLLEKIRSQHRSVPALVFMTGFADISLEEAYDKGAVAMFGKPFNRKELIDTVSRSVLPYKDRWAKEYRESDLQFAIDLSFESFQSAKKNRRFNLGHGGLFVALDAKLPAVSEHTSFKINFKGDKVKTIEGSGIVRWVRRQSEPTIPKGIGVEIRSIVGENRLDVFDLIDSQDIIAYIPKY